MRLLARSTPIVIKVCFPDKEFYTEAEALLYDGIIRLLAADLGRAPCCSGGCRWEALRGWPMTSRPLLAVSVMKKLDRSWTTFPDFLRWAGTSP
jgi:hypothetical protein